MHGSLTAAINKHGTVLPLETMSCRVPFTIFTCAKLHDLELAFRGLRLMWVIRDGQFRDHEMTPCSNRRSNVESLS